MNTETNTMRSALDELLQAAKRSGHTSAYDAALLAAYDSAVDLGRGDLEEALSALPPVPSPRAAGAVTAIRAAL